MATAAPAPLKTAKSVWAARIIAGLCILFLAADAIGKLVRPAPVVEATTQLGYPASALVGLGMTLLAGTILYAIPRTAVLGAVLLTGYLGGAVATHVRVGQPFYFPIGMGVLLWLALYLTDARIRALLPLRS